MSLPFNRVRVTGPALPVLPDVIVQGQLYVSVRDFKRGSIYIGVMGNDNLCTLVNIESGRNIFRTN